MGVKRYNEHDPSAVDGNTYLIGYQEGGDPGNRYSRDALAAGLLVGRGPLLSITPLPAAGTLTWMNQGGATATDHALPSGNAITLLAPAAAGIAIRGLQREAANGNVTACMQISHFAGNINNAGIYIRDSADKVVRMGIYYSESTGTWNYYAGSHNNATSVVTSYFDIAALDGPMSPTWLRIRHADGTRFFEWSSSGLAWRSLFSHAAGTFLTPAHAGVQVDSQNGSAAIAATFFSLATD